MAIDWFTLICQALNFLILVWLLKRYLYKPVLNAVEAREKRIADELSAARAKQLEADQQSADFKGKLAELAQNRDELLKKTVEEAKRLQEQVTIDGKAELDRDLQKKRAQASAEQRDLLAGLGQKIREEALLIAREVLVQLANTDMNSQMIEIFLTKIEALPENQKSSIQQGLSSAGSLTINTAFEVSQSLRDKIEHTLQAVFGKGTAPTYQLDPALINGIELSIGGKKVAWSISERLDSFAIASA